MVKVVAIDEGKGRKPKRLGFLGGVFKVPGDFDRTGRDEIEALFGAKP